LKAAGCLRCQCCSSPRPCGWSGGGQPEDWSLRELPPYARSSRHLRVALFAGLVRRLPRFYHRSCCLSRAASAPDLWPADYLRKLKVQQSYLAAVGALGGGAQENDSWAGHTSRSWPDGNPISARLFAPMFRCDGGLASI
jgi:hypothetical protein